MSRAEVPAPANRRMGTAAHPARYRLSGPHGFRTDLAQVLYQPQITVRRQNPRNHAMALPEVQNTTTSQMVKGM